MGSDGAEDFNHPKKKHWPGQAEISSWGNNKVEVSSLCILCSMGFAVPSKEQEFVLPKTAVSGA